MQRLQNLKEWELKSEEKMIDKIFLKKPYNILSNLIQHPLELPEQETSEKKQKKLWEKFPLKKPNFPLFASFVLFFDV